MFALTLFSAAMAASNQVSLEAGWLGAPDPNWQTFSPGYSYGTGGVRVGLKVHERVTAVVGWQHGKTGMGLNFEGDTDYVTDDEGYYDEYDYGSASELGAAFSADQITLGAKADWDLLRWLNPYVVVSGVGMRGVVRFDEDPDDDDNIGQRAVAGMSGGVLATAGLDFPIHLGKESRYAIVPSLEMGYGWIAPMRFEDVGRLQFHGFAGRAGVGLHF